MCLKIKKTTAKYLARHVQSINLPVPLNKWGESNGACIFKRLWDPGIDSNLLIPPAYVALRAGTITLFLLSA